MMAQQDKINFREVNDGLEEVIQSKEDCPSTPPHGNLREVGVTEKQAPLEKVLKG